MRQDNTFGVALVSKMMSGNIDMLSPILVDRIVAHLNGSLIVDEYLKGFGVRSTDFFKKLPEPYGFTSGKRS